MSSPVEGNLDYACARVGAREGARPDATAWGRIETTRELRSMLDVARTSSLAAWTSGIAADTEPHAIERALRRHWRSLAREVMRWMPARWQPAVAWFAFVVDLPLLDALQRAEAPPSWSGDDPEYRTWIAERTHPLLESSCTLPHAPDSPVLSRAWREGWQRRLPPSHASEAPRLSDWLHLLSRHEAAMRAAPPGDATLLVQALHERLRALRRRALLEPTAVFVFLTQSALDVARFRGEVMRRRLFPTLAPTP
jgi:hypothetical protein